MEIKQEKKGGRLTHIAEITGEAALSNVSQAALITLQNETFLGSFALRKSEINNKIIAIDEQREKLSEIGYDAKKLLSPEVIYENFTIPKLNRNSIITISSTFLGSALLLSVMRAPPKLILPTVVFLTLASLALRFARHKTAKYFINTSLPFKPKVDHSESLKELKLRAQEKYQTGTPIKELAKTIVNDLTEERSGLVENKRAIDGELTELHRSGGLDNLSRNSITSLNYSLLSIKNNKKRHFIVEQLLDFLHDANINIQLGEVVEYNGEPDIVAAALNEEILEIAQGKGVSRDVKMLRLLARLESIRDMSFD